jgi:hypothetical protein
MKALFCFFLIFSGQVFAQSIQRIPLKITDSYQTNYVGQNVTNLIDGKHSTRFNPGYNLIIRPHNIVFDLSDYAPCIVKRFVLWDGTGNNYNCQFILVHADSGKEDTVYTFTGDDYLKSDTIDIPSNKQFVASKFILRSPGGGDGYPDDLEIWGDFTPHSDPVWSRPKIQIKNQLGVVAHPWDMDLVQYPAKYKALKDLGVSDIRLYSDAYANKDVNGNYMLNPDQRGFQPETTFSQLEKDSTTILRHICYQNQSLSVKKTWPSSVSSQLNFEYQYYNLRDSVSSYQSIARDLFVLATRGGKNKNLPDYPVYNSPYWWETRQQVLKGEGFYDLIEGGNEWNAWWMTSLDYYMGGSSLAAAWSMMYDGHNKKYAHCGVKQADPNILFTNGGIASDQPDIFREAVDWWKSNRGYLPDGSVDIPLDYYSYHSYSSVDGQYGNSKGGVPPEIGMIPQARNMVYFSNKYGGGKGVIIGEWGWDVNQGSPINAPSFNGHTPEQTRAWWAARGILKFTEVGIYRAEWFRAFQDYMPGDPKGGNYASDNDPTQFATMALLRQENDAATIIKRTLVGDYFKQLSEFGDYVFDEAIRSDSINVLRFKKDTNSIYAVWAVENVAVPTDQRPVITERTGIYNLQLPLNAIVRIRNFVDDGSGIMQSTYDMAAGNDLAIHYSAKPQIVQVIGQGYVLPIQLVSFTAIQKDNAVKVSWSVQNENIANYIIERSADGVHYSILNKIKGTREINYQVIDHSPLEGNNYYRLKMIDEKGLSKYSPIRMVTIKTGKIKYVAYNYLGQKIMEGENFFELNKRVKSMLHQWQPYIISGSDGSVVKFLKQQD